MLRLLYEPWLFRPFYQQCLLAFGVFVAVMMSGYFSCLREERFQLKRHRLAVQNLEHTLQKEKSQYRVVAQEASLFMDETARAYLNIPTVYRETSFLMSKISDLILKAGFLLKQIDLKDEKEKEGHRLFLIRFKALGTYPAFVQFCLSMTQQPYFVQMVQFHLEKQKEGGDEALYVDVFMHVYIFK